MSRKRCFHVAFRLVGALLALAAGIGLSLVTRTYLAGSGRPPPSAPAPESPIARLRCARDQARETRTDLGTEAGGESRDGGLFTVLDAATLEPVTECAGYLRRGESAEALVIRSGAFDLPARRPEGAFVRLEAPGYFALEAPLDALPEEGCDLHLVPEEPFVVTCFASDSHEPVQGASIRANAGSADAAAVTDEAGSAAIAGLAIGLRGPAPEGAAPAHEARVEVTSAGFLEKNLKVPILPGEPWGRLEVLLDRTRTILVRTVDARSGDPVPDTKVFQHWMHPDRLDIHRDRRVLTTDDDGRVRLEIRDGARDLEVVAAHDEHATRGVEVGSLDGLPRADGGEPELRIELEPAAEAEGIVIDEDGIPVPRVLVDLEPLGRPDFTPWMRAAANGHLGQPPDMGMTDTDGRFVIPRVAAGEYAVLLSHREHHADPENPPLRAGETREAWVGVLRRGLEIQGTVTDEAGEGLEDIFVGLSRVDDAGRSIRGFAKTLRTGKDGSFAARGVLPGRYEALVSPGPAYTGLSRVVETDGIPQPWTIVLHRNEAPPGPALGALWLEVRGEGDRIVGGTASVRLYRADGGDAAEAMQRDLYGGGLYAAEVPCGTYHAVVEVEGYAPAVLPLVDVVQDPAGPVVAMVSPGVLSSVEVSRTNGPAALEVIEASVGVPVAGRILPASPEDRQVAIRLEPGGYRARLRLGGGEAVEEWLAVGATRDPVLPRLRLVAPGEGTP